MRKWLRSKALWRWYRAEPGSKAESFYRGWMVRLSEPVPESDDLGPVHG